MVDPLPALSMVEPVWGRSDETEQERDPLPFAPSRPKLPLGSLFASMADDADRFSREELKANLQRITDISHVHSMKQKEVLSAQGAISDREKEAGVWTLLGNLALVLSASASIVIGVLSGGVAGALIAASGVTSVVSLTLSQLNLHPNWTGAMALVAAGAAAVGATLNVTVAAGQLNTVVGSIVAAATSLASGALSVKKGWTEAQLTWLRQKINDLSHCITHGQIEMSEIHKQSAEAMEQAVEQAKHAAALLEKQEEAKQLMMRA